MARPAFTVLEIIFVVVIIAVVSSFLLPRLDIHLYNTQVLKLKAHVLKARDYIASTHQSKLFLLIDEYPATLENTLDSKIWHKTSVVLNYDLHNHNKEVFEYADGKVVLTYTYNSLDGSFVCDSSNSVCQNVEQ